MQDQKCSSNRIAGQAILIHYKTNVKYTVRLGPATGLYSILYSTHNGLGMEAVRAQARGKTVGAYAVKTVRVYEGRKQLNFMLLKKTVAAYALDKHKSLSFRK